MDIDWTIKASGLYVTRDLGSDHYTSTGKKKKVIRRTIVVERKGVIKRIIVAIKLWKARKIIIVII